MLPCPTCGAALALHGRCACGYDDRRSSAAERAWLAETLGTHPSTRPTDTGRMFDDLSELLTIRIAGVDLVLAVHLVDGRTRWALGGPRYLWPVRWAALA